MTQSSNEYQFLLSCTLTCVYYQRFFLPDDLGSDQCARREVVTEDTVVAAEILCGLLKFSSSCDAP